MKISASIRICLLCALIAFSSHLAYAAEEKSPLEITADSALEWDQNDKTYTARGNALAKQGTSSVKADTLIAHYTGANNSTSDIHLLEAEGNVILISGDKTAKGDKATYDLTTGEAELIGKRPSVKQGEKSELAADKIRIWTITDASSGKTGSLIKAEAEGHVVITSGTQIATGDKAIYIAETNIAELIGHVQIKQDQNLLEGDKAEVNLTTRISKMTGTNEKGRVKGVFYTGKKD